MAIYTLSQLSESLRNVLATQFAGSYRIIAETMDVRRNASTGHCYMELVEKAEENDRIVAKAKAIIWRERCATLFARFQQVTGRAFESGLTVLVTVKVEYHPVFGLSLQVVGIEPEYTLGDIAQKRREQVERLKREGIFQRNKQIPFPRPTRLIAVVSSPTAAGWGDFRHHLEENAYRFPFFCQLFSATMQGEATEKSILAALAAIKTSKLPFDAVVIIRGGGAVSDLCAFDSYELAREVACFPLPILTGIGHYKDESLLDLVAARPLKTPTAVADFLIRSRLELFTELEMLKERVLQSIRESVSDKHYLLSESALRLPAIVGGLLLGETNRLTDLQQRLVRLTLLKLRLNSLVLNTFTAKLPTSLKHTLWRHNDKREQLTLALPLHIRSYTAALREMLERRAQLIALLSPQKTLERGFSIVKIEGLSVRDAEQLSLGAEVAIHLANGGAEARITTIVPSSKSP